MLTANRRNTLAWLGLIPLLLIMVALAAHMLNADILYVDEYYSVWMSGGASYGPIAPNIIYRRVILFDYGGGMGVLYYYTLAGWEALVGGTPFGARLFSLMVGVLAVAFTYRMGRDMHSPRAGLYAAAVVAASAFFVDYLHEARAYTLLVLLAAFTVWAYWRVLSAPGRVPWWRYGLLFAGMAGLAYSHYTGLVLAGVIGLYHLLIAPKDRRWLFALIAMLLAAALYLPWVSVLLNVLQQGTRQTLRQATAMDAGLTIQTLAHAFSNANLALLALLLIAALAIRSRAARLTWFWGIGLLAMVLLINLFIPFMVHLRYLMPLWPALALVVALGMLALERRGVTRGLLLAVWIGAGIYQSFQPAFIDTLFGQIYRAPKAGIDAGLQVLRDQSRAGDLALYHISQPGFETFNYFVMDYLNNGLLVRYDQIERMHNSFAQDDNSYLKDVRASIGGAAFIWTLVVPEIPTTNKTGVVDYVLRTQYAHCETVLDRPDMKMDFYARPPVDPAPDVLFSSDGGDVKLYLLRSVQAEGVLDVTLGWATDPGVPDGVYSVGLHLDDSGGDMAAQNDYGLPVGPWGCHTSQIPVDSLAAGDYTLHALIYARQGGARLTGEADGESSDSVPLEPVTITPAN